MRKDLEKEHRGYWEQLVQRPWGRRGVKVARVTGAELDEVEVVTGGIGETTCSCHTGHLWSLELFSRQYIFVSKKIIATINV